MSRKTIPATAVTARAFARVKRLSAALLIGSAALATITVASAAGAFGDTWQSRSMRTWQQAQLLAERYEDLARVQPIFYWVITRKRTSAAAVASATARKTPANRTDSTAKPGNPAASGTRPVSSTVPSSVPSYTPVASGGGMTSANSSRARLVRLPTTLPYVDRNSAAYSRFKSWVDSAVNGSPGYGFAAIEAALMYQLSPEAKYCTLAVRMVEQQVADAEAVIAGGGRPAISGDSYLEVGPMIADLAMTMQTCSAMVTASQRTRWSAYAQQAVWNLWNHEAAQWGGRSFPWSGWSVNNPGNNYYYSFVEATMYWALASNNATWMNELRGRLLPALEAYFARLPGGGSSEGTGYGTSHMRLFSIYHLWREATGVDLANSNPHATDSIYYWIHATVPTRDRFAPIGDQARNSMPELYDYHRRLMLQARLNTYNESAQREATWWLANISVPRMTSGFNYRHDLMPAGAVATQPAGLIHYAQGTGHLFARTDWSTSAMWLAIVAGPYNESHAHQDQGSFTLFAQDWLAVTANVWSASGINQGTDVHNLVRFVRNGTVARQCESTTRKSTLAVTPGSGGAFTAAANLTPAFCDNTAVTSWQRQFTFGSRKLTVRDQFAITSGTTATFQVNVPVQPVLVNSREATAGRLRVRVLEPANATINSNFSTGKYVEGGGRFRIDVTGGTTGYLVELTEI
ncbi:MULTISPECIES: hypothetical protein [unclassified Pseudoxanthomonas]|uniref:hypothetical protein n=1 Tax=unclassified Pseudoxanthomonas TaxID=2645906 RepID=UPI0030780170